ncbi:type VI secretion system contractile sheath large subunit [Corallococcus sp. H22C18031201]|uniref:type VI secretion system contractile sheath large subunit n=1 Tax=Citreicoccus inhibens TaxID=2849499 RepID=UPI000E759861|nr:type VI secretion system contractile sheath large subunit [Citreicoccus inhibens]MBU8900869.1 type VI secretion system contractile sheath large subunit [Citreicoccus inhibens]RJS14499.1 type VI secretion system contractile sheath large subunit [Corallococcus sp. H22C18031201]
MGTETQVSKSTSNVADVSLLDEILSEAKLKPKDEGYDVARRGVQAFITEMLAPNRSEERVDKALVDAMIAEIDKRLSSQVNEILHVPEFQKLESAWRSLKFLVDRVDFRENTRVEMLNLSKEDLQKDFEDSPEVVKSGMYKIAYSNEYGVFGGKPYGLLCGNYDFGTGPQDMELLRKCASVAAMSHAPFIANASPEMFGEDSFTKLPDLKDLKSLFEGPQYARWHSFRESEDARYVGLCLPRFLLRLPYGEKTIPVKAFNFSEEVVGSHEKYLWGYASTAFATRVTDSFAKFRWSPNIIGPQSGGAVENLPLHQYEAMGELQTKIPTEVLLTERREYELSEEGLIGLVFRKDADNAAFFSANSAQKPKFFGNTPEGKSAETNYRLGTQLPYMFIMTRLAHYIKVLQREQIGSWKEKSDLERELNHWISQYIADMDDPAPAVRSRRPLRAARITVEDVEGQPGWYRCSLQVRPHFKYMGASFTLSLIGKLDKE